MLNYDAQATTPLEPEVAALMDEARARHWANPSGSYRTGREARAALDAARDRAAAALDAPGGRVIFCGSGTEANALALLGAVDEGRRPRLVLPATEHASVLRAGRAHEAAGGAVWSPPVIGAAAGGSEVPPLRAEHPRSLTRSRGAAEHLPLPPTETPSPLEGGAGGLTGGGGGARGGSGIPPVIGAPDPAALAEARAGDWWALMPVNNELGTVNPAGAWARALAARGALLHCDGAAAVGRVPVDLSALGAASCACAPHKFGGPRGCGLLWLADERRYRALTGGGAQEFGLRPGTEDVAAAIGAARALELAQARARAAPAALPARRTRLIAGLRAAAPGLIVHEGPPDRQAPGILNVALPGRDARALLMALDLAGAAASRGSACESGAEQPSHVLRALGLPSEELRGSLRLSFCDDTGPDDDERLLAVFAELLARPAG